MVSTSGTYGSHRNTPYIILWLPFFFKDGSLKTLLLKEIHCKWCTQIFYVCQHCWRGQAYCSDTCRQASKRRSRRRAQQKYRRTEKGKRRHRQAERRRRVRQGKKIMDDPSSTPDDGHATVLQNSKYAAVCCRFCGKTGRIVTDFPRRGYGGRYLRAYPPPFISMEAWHDNKTTPC